MRGFSRAKLDMVCEQPQQLTWAFSLGRNLGVDMKTIISIHVIAYIYIIFIYGLVFRVPTPPVWVPR